MSGNVSKPTGCTVNLTLEGSTTGAIAIWPSSKLGNFLPPPFLVVVKSTLGGGATSACSLLIVAFVMSSTRQALATQSLIGSRSIDLRATVSKRMTVKGCRDDHVRRADSVSGWQPVSALGSVSGSNRNISSTITS